MRDAQAIARELMAMSGLDGLRAMVEGRFPPPSIAETMGFTLVHVEHGVAVFEGEPSDRILTRWAPCMAAGR